MNCQLIVFGSALPSGLGKPSVLPIHEVRIDDIRHLDCLAFFLLVSLLRAGMVNAHVVEM